MPEDERLLLEEELSDWVEEPWPDDEESNEAVPPAEAFVPEEALFPEEVLFPEEALPPAEVLFAEGTAFVWVNTDFLPPLNEVIVAFLKEVVPLAFTIKPISVQPLGAIVLL